MVGPVRARGLHGFFEIEVDVWGEMRDSICEEMEEKREKKVAFCENDRVIVLHYNDKNVCREDGR